MKGKILGADANSGSITGEDGKRYKFDSPQWKSERKPMAGDSVDFEISDKGQALEIYLLKGSDASLNFDEIGQKVKTLFGESANSNEGGHIIALLKGNILFQISLVILIASCFLTFVKIGGSIGMAGAQALPSQGAYEIITLSDLADFLKTSADTSAATLDSLVASTRAYMPQGLPNTSQPYAQAKDMAGNLRTFSELVNVLYLFYLVPLGAAAMAVQLFRSKDIGFITFATGVASVGSFVLLVVLRDYVGEVAKSAAIGMGNPNAAEEIASLAEKAVSFGLGSYLILLCGIGILGIVFGFIRVPNKVK